MDDIWRQRVLGKLAVKEAVSRGLKLILAGRSKAIQDVAQEFELDFQIFNLDNG